MDNNWLEAAIFMGLKILLLNTQIKAHEANIILVDQDKINQVFISLDREMNALNDGRGNDRDH